MAGRLVEDHLSVLQFFDEQEAPVVFDDGGDGDMGLPFHRVVSLKVITQTPALGQGLWYCREAYTSAAIAALSVALGRMAWLISSALAW